jgi:hypothetical protein
MKTGMSVFILCVNTEKAVKQIKNIVQSKRWKVETRVVIEDGKLGVRIWRVL